MEAKAPSRAHLRTVVTVTLNNIATSAGRSSEGGFPLGGRWVMKGTLPACHRSMQALGILSSF